MARISAMRRSAAAMFWGAFPPCEAQIVWPTMGTFRHGSPVLVRRAVHLRGSGGVSGGTIRTPPERE
jgi:hypothetical protein